MSSRLNEGLSCPICGKSFPPFEIEEHANKCLFLASENDSSSSLKKFSDVQHTSPRVKRLKHEEPHPLTKSAIGSGSNSVSDKEFSSDNGLLDGTGKDEDNMEDSVSLIVSTVPLAEQMRPVDLTCFVGQSHVLGQDKVLRTLLQKQDIPSMILWGPPGCGKTTLAHIIAKQCRGGAERVRFVKLSATMSGVNEIKEAVKVAKNELGFKRRTILFMDEIHRFNKLQQDIFLPHIESGTITLIGATTENPSFSLNSALLSRCRVIVLEKLDTESLVTILTRAVRGVGGRVVHQGLTPSEPDTPRFLMDSETVLWLAEMCDGDARIALNSLQLALQSRDTVPGRILMISLDDIKDGVKRSHLLYDKKGEEHYNIVSAMHKSIRASDDNAALYWLTRMLQGGEDPVFIARRLVRAASEDIGLANPMAVTMAVSAMQACQLLGLPECDVHLAQCAVFLARAPKSTEVYRALLKAKECISEHKGALPSVPLHLRNAPTRLMKDLGYGKGYNTADKEQSNLLYMPEGLEDVNFFL